MIDRTSGSFSGTFISWCLTASGPTADAGGQTPVAEGLGPLKLSAALTARPFANLVFTSAMRLAVWLVDRVQLHASVLADGRPALTASPPSGEVWRSYYYSGGQRIAMRVQDGSGDEVFYLLADHLGSTTITADELGTFYSEMRYEPWGEIWYDSAAQNGNATPTDFHFTGQRDHSGDFGLMFYQARWYDGYLGQFSQPDMIILNPGNPTDFNRYSYVGYNAVNFTDPSGHLRCGINANPHTVQGQSGYEDDCAWPKASGGGIPDLVAFEVDQQHPQQWTDAEKEVIRAGAMVTATAYANTINTQVTRINRLTHETGISAATVTPAEAFLAVHEGPVVFTRSSAAPGWAGYTFTKNQITIYNVPTAAGTIITDYLVRHPRLVVHELGHAFNQAVSGAGASSLAGLLRPNHGNPGDDYWGFAGGWADWQYGATHNSGEVFADMFIGWVYGRWGAEDLADQRRDHMNSLMWALVVSVAGP